MKFKKLLEKFDPVKAKQTVVKGLLFTCDGKLNCSHFEVFNKKLTVQQVDDVIYIFYDIATPTHNTWHNDLVKKLQSVVKKPVEVAPFTCAYVGEEPRDKVVCDIGAATNKVFYRYEDLLQECAEVFYFGF